MRLPTQVQIGPFWYAIERSTIPDEVQRWGETALNSKIVRIGTQTSATQAPITLLHEFVHAVATTYQIDALIARDSDDKEETIIALSHGLAQALQSIGWMPHTLEENDD